MEPEPIPAPSPADAEMRIDYGAEEEEDVAILDAAAAPPSTTDEMMTEDVDALPIDETSPILEEATMVDESEIVIGGPEVGVVGMDELVEQENVEEPREVVFEEGEGATEEPLPVSEDTLQVDESTLAVAEDEIVPTEHAATDPVATLEKSTSAPPANATEGGEDATTFAPPAADTTTTTNGDLSNGHSTPVVATSDTTSTAVPAVAPPPFKAIDTQPGDAVESSSTEQQQVAEEVAPAVEATKSDLETVGTATASAEEPSTKAIEAESFSHHEEPAVNGGDATHETVEEVATEGAEADVAEEATTVQSTPASKTAPRVNHDATSSQSSLARPSLSKNDLNEVYLEDGEGRSESTRLADSSHSSTNLVAPSVLLSYQGETYQLFRRQSIIVDGQEGDEVTVDESTTLLFDKAEEQSLYYDPIESLVAALRRDLPDLDSSGEELVFDFEAMGVSLPEDNVYTREVSLFDLARIHAGCHLPGGLQFNLVTQPRFSTGFNSLVDYIAKSLVDGPDSTLIAVSTSEEEVDDGSGEGQFDDDDADDATFEDGEWHGEEGEGEGAGEGEEYDLEEALADLDSDDLNAVIEGVQEDYFVAEEAMGDGDEVSGEGEHEEGAVLGSQEEHGVGGEDPEGAYVDGEEQEVEQQLPIEELEVVVEEVEDQVIPTQETQEAPETGINVEEVVEEVPSSSLELTTDTATSLAPPVSEPEISYDTPLGTGLEAPSIPLGETGAVVDAAQAKQPSPLTLATELVDDSVDAVEDQPDENDVVIDYEEVEAVPAVDVSKFDKDEGPLSPKRGRSLDETVEVGEDVPNGDAKRARLVDPDPVPVSTA